MKVNKVYGSWNDNQPLDERNVKDWDRFKEVTGGTPAYYSIWNSKIRLSPVPNNDEEFLTVEAYLDLHENDMADEVAPETPTFLDELLIYSILKRINPMFVEEYEYKLAKLKGTMHKSTGPLQSSPTSEAW